VEVARGTNPEITVAVEGPPVGLPMVEIGRELVAEGST
jgi:hypothetical protein